MQPTLSTDIADNRYILNYCFDEYKDRPGNNIIDLNDKELNKISIQPNFQSILSKSWISQIKPEPERNKTLSILHTNICSINANPENLELLLNNIEHNFDIIAVCET